MRYIAMKKQHQHPNPELIDKTNPEWTDEMFRAAKRIDQLPAELQGKLRSQGKMGSQKAPTKI